MKAKNIYIVIAVASGSLWFWNLFDVVKIVEIWKGIRVGYLFLGWLVPILSTVAFFEESHPNIGKGYFCDRCGSNFRSTDVSKHIVNDQRSYDICEKCIPFVKTTKDIVT